MTSMYFKVRDTVSPEKVKLLEYLFKDWVDDTCNNEVYYDSGVAGIFKVNFEKQQDAVALKLKGLPAEFKDYLYIVI